VNLEVVDASQEEHVQHAGQRREPPSEGADARARVGLQAHRHDGLQRAAQRLGGQVGVKAPDHPGILQAAHPHQAGGRGQSHVRGQHVVGRAGVGGQDAQDLVIGLVQLGIPANLLRRMRLDPRHDLIVSPILRSNPNIVR
jgi:hypothetical protein